jgi:hypothetical protein
MAISGQQTDADGIAPRHQPITVVLDQLSVRLFYSGVANLSRWPQGSVLPNSEGWALRLRVNFCATWDGRA